MPEAFFVRSFSASLSRLYSAARCVADLLCPPQCVVCGHFPEWAEDSPTAADPDRLLLCGQCRRLIVEDGLLLCPRCAKPLAHSCSETIGCGACWNEKFHFDSAVALGEYHLPLSKQILSMKRETEGVLAETFALLLCRERKDRLLSVGADLVIPVPMHPLRHLVRGVNSAELIARVVAARLGIDCRTNIVRRIRWTVRQATLSGDLRRKNILGAFRVFPRCRNEIDGKRILLVDDVMTAGTAVREVVPKLKAEANVEIVGLVLSADRMEKTRDSDISAVEAVRKEFGFPVLSIANVKQIFAAAAEMTDVSGQPLLSDDVAAAADEYMKRYGA